jgi:integrase
MPTERDDVLMSVLAYAGLRPGEALALKWGNIGGRTILVERSLALGELKARKTPIPMSSPSSRTHRSDA